MTKTKTSALLLSCTVSLAPCLLLGQVQRPGEYPRGEKPSPMMNFFVTSEPIGDGGNLGGLAGADAHCQALATAVGAGNRTWHAYLSTQARRQTDREVLTQSNRLHYPRVPSSSRCNIHKLYRRTS